MNIITNGTHVLPSKWDGGWGRINITGNFGGATVQLAYARHGTYIPFGDNTSFTSAGIDGKGARFLARYQDSLALIVADGVGLDLIASVEAMHKTANDY